MRQKRAGIEVWDLDGSGLRCAVAVDGVVRFVGEREQCLRRAELLVTRDDREYQDRMLLRAVS
ncbi:MAG TPA: hypothetical protein VF007_07680 [Stellaceae bacterium]